MAKGAAALVVGGIAFGVVPNMDKIMDCPTGVEWTPKPECKNGLPLPFNSKARWPVAASSASGETVTGAVQYRIVDLATREGNPDIGIVTETVPDVDKFNRVVGVDLASQKPLDEVKNWESTQYYAKAVLQNLGAQACLTDMSEVVSRAQAGAAGLVQLNPAVTLEELQGAESLYGLKDHGGTTPDNPAIPNVYVVYERPPEAPADGTTTTTAEGADAPPRVMEVVRCT